MTIDPAMAALLVSVIVPVASGAAAWGGSRQALNGTRERVKSIDEKMDKHINQTSGNIQVVTERIAVVETKVDDLKERIN